MSEHRISTVGQLRTLYREPSVRVQGKKAATIGPQTAAWLAAAPFALLATSDESGRCDVSPRGGPPGMIQMIDESAIALPDLGGNNLLDSLTNIIANPQVGLLVLNPGSDETVRIDGPAELTTDPAVLDLWDGLLRKPKLAIKVEVTAIFSHCAKAFRRSGLWEPTSWNRDVADMCVLFNEQSGSNQDVAEMRDFLEQDYTETLAEEQPV